MSADAPAIPTFIARPEWYGDGSPNPLPASGRALRWGVVATGSISNTVTADLALLEDAVLQAVSSRSEQSAAQFARKFGFASSYSDQDGVPGYQRMFDDPLVDVVYIGTPHGQHFEVAKAALLSGKHVLCEKALTINAREAEELIRLAGERGLFLMEALWSRFTPGVQRAVEIVSSGALGEIHWVRADLGFPAPQDLNSRIWAPEAGGGALLDLTVYPLVWAWGMLGAPDSVQASGTLTDWGVDAQNAITLEYSRGAHAQLMSSLLAQGPRQASVAGSKGWLSTLGSVPNPSGLSIRYGWNGSGWDEERSEEFSPVGSGYTYQLREVSRCIQQGLQQSPTMPWQDSLDIMRLFDGVRAQLGVSYPNDQR
ncbi:putative dehydrogenase [Psychromicrobium silvestre]|uniref:Putative dehydrogenase n=1 Tax=Psychromicrobium silvestre TaxID=1645614 RepID=A0A7Y9S8G7_9MICC|nr:Gfo/Idh/MocA family oxidoreductase [Psychromicrobium silvestre]NYE96440.1 putative dehydrogenase [Psychromicrobium silvestre]